MTVMVQRFFVFMCILAVAALGLQPAVAHSAPMMTPANVTAESMHADCVCPPEHGVPSPDKSPCAPSLLCMIDCGVVPTVTAAESNSPIEPFFAQQALFSEIVAPPSSASDPPFRPPSF